MSSKKPYEQFGSYILFKKLESDVLGDLFRAARIEDRTLGPMIALHRLTGGNRQALVASANSARQVTSVLHGTSFVREQVIDVVDGVPIVAHDYAGGRSLRHIVNRARGLSGGGTANPIPVDQAIAIAERVALSLATTAELRFGGERLLHGALVPHFVWITDDGEIRVAGQQLGKGLLSSLGDSKISHEIGRYFSPEYQHSKEPSRSSEVYSLGAILFLVITGHEPPDPMSTSAFMNTLRAAKTMAGTPIPDDIRKVLEKSLSLDPSVRFAAPADMKHALSALSANYSATTFNLAFYLSNLLKKEMESEAAERERESKVNVAPYLGPVTAPGTTPAPALTMPAPKKSRLPMAVAAAVAVVLIGGGVFFAVGMKKTAAAPRQQLASVVPANAPARPAVAIPDPLVASPGTTAPTSAATMTDSAGEAAARKKAFEDAVKQKLREEMMKLQAEYTRNLQQQQSKNAPVVAQPAPEQAAPPASLASTSTEDHNPPSAAQLDQQRREIARPQPEVTATQIAAQPPPAAPAVTQTQAALSTQAPPPVVAVPAGVREGDVVDYGSLDTTPAVVRPARVIYPPIAAKQRIETTVMLTILVSETGDVSDVKILRGDPRFGFNDAAMAALRRAKYTSPMKDGKRVKTWIPQMIQFKP